MRLVEVALEKFRGYGQRSTVALDDLTVLIGRNDSGKSTFLEALYIALGDGKVDPSDINVRARVGESVSIECTFDGLPVALTLDSGSQTTLADEYLVDADGRLRLRWSYVIVGDAAAPRLGKEQIRVIANHPSNEGLSDLHATKNKDLKLTVKKAGVESLCDLNNNASMRQALWKHADDAGTLKPELSEIDLAKEDGKAILDQIKAVLPIYALFRADRPSTDQDAEVQDPMKVAIRTALEELKDEVDVMKARVQERALEVANRTLESLRSFDNDLATSLSPEFADPKLESAFKLALMGDDGIAVNKRGSGVRRLVLFSFFQAEADRRQNEIGNRSIIYAIEEPETAQHPDFQRMVVKALRRLSQAEGCQVLITTHSPGLAGLLPSESVRLISVVGPDRNVTSGENALSDAIRTLGVVPDHRVRVLVCVEGPTDRAFLQSACRCYRAAGEPFACLESDPTIAFILLGGSTLLEWASDHLLRHTGIPEFHLYDSDSKYGKAVGDVNSRGGDHSARQTHKREIENYIHPDAIHRVLSGPAGNLGGITFGPQDDVAAVVASAMPDSQGNPRNKLKRRDVKNWLNHEVAAAMTVDEFDAQDPHAELKGWLTEITRIAQRDLAPFS